MDVGIDYQSIEATLLILPPESRSNIDPAEYLSLIQCPYPIDATEKVKFFLSSLVQGVELERLQNSHCGTDKIKHHYLKQLRKIQDGSNEIIEILQNETVGGERKNKMIDYKKGKVGR
ncbi:hypothetical protein TrLO_g2947 [Triparma laevis f. longispina]|uniref:Uncharacterized protein n=1 Tax=Triparma laevis f. longispina TaxID=1714387 RepID=A0A9W7KV63_9STRA|nr:hypothetical protein TrLO_g2947 [Triparma laevis f. longispina]